MTLPFALLMALTAHASEPLMRLSADAVTYRVGATAHLEATVLAPPHESEDDFYIGSTLNGTNLELIQEPNGPGIAAPILAASGNFVWTVQLYLENAKLAASLLDGINSLNFQNAGLQTQIGQTTDPTKLAALQAQLSANNSELAELQAELTHIRHPFGASQSLTFSAQ
jgi:hypothetical protein